MEKKSSWRTKFLFSPDKKEPHKISRSKIDLFIECPRCFYLGERHGVKRPSLPGFTLNIAVDELLKKEFDVHREHKTTHPIMKENGIDAIPFSHPDLDAWRQNFVGVQALHKPTNLLIFGAVDDVWITPKEELIVVDYKATSKRSEINLDEGWGPQYKRQLEVYQWLLRQNGFKVSNTGYFVYCNGNKDLDVFDKKLEFIIEVIPHTGADVWVEQTLLTIKKCLLDERIPSPKETCEYCKYRISAYAVENISSKKQGTQTKKEEQSKLF